MDFGPNEDRTMKFAFLRDDLVENFQDIEFNRNGSEMFILSKSSTELNNQILQFSLGKNYDPATATYVGAYTLDFSLDGLVLWLDLLD